MTGVGGRGNRMSTGNGDLQGAEPNVGAGNLSAPRMRSRLSQQHLARLNDSLERCHRDPRFMDRVCASFVDSSEEIATKFAQIDARRLKLIVTAALYTSLSFASRQQRGDPELERLAQAHGHTAYDVRPELYDLWLDAVVGAVRASDPQFTPITESAWRAVLGCGVEFMRARY